MAQSDEGLAFGPKASAGVILAGVEQELERHLAAQLGVMSAKDRSGAAAPERSSDFKASDVPHVGRLLVA